MTSLYILYTHTALCRTATAALTAITSSKRHLLFCSASLYSFMVCAQSVAVEWYKGSTPVEESNKHSPYWRTMYIPRNTDDGNLTTQSLIVNHNFNRRESNRSARREANNNLRPRRRPANLGCKTWQHRIKRRMLMFVFIFTAFFGGMQRRTKSECHGMHGQIGLFIRNEGL